MRRLSFITHHSPRCQSCTRPLCSVSSKRTNVQPLWADDVALSPFLEVEGEPERDAYLRRRTKRPVDAREEADPVDAHEGHDVDVLRRRGEKLDLGRKQAGLELGGQRHRLGALSEDRQTDRQRASNQHLGRVWLLGKSGRAFTWILIGWSEKVCVWAASICV